MLRFNTAVKSVNPIAARGERNHSRLRKHLLLFKIQDQKKKKPHSLHLEKKKANFTNYENGESRSLQTSCVDWNVKPSAYKKDISAVRMHRRNVLKWSSFGSHLGSTLVISLFLLPQITSNAEVSSFCGGTSRKKWKGRWIWRGGRLRGVMHFGRGTSEEVEDRLSERILGRKVQQGGSFL